MLITEKDVGRTIIARNGQQFVIQQCKPDENLNYPVLLTRNDRTISTTKYGKYDTYSDESEYDIIAFADTRDNESLKKRIEVLEEEIARIYSIIGVDRR